MLDKTKPNSYTESFTVKCGRERGKERVSTRGGLADAFGEDIFEKCVVTTNCEKSAEAIVPGKKSWEKAIPYFV